jgi:cation-transporting P-type ATPase I
VVVADAPRIIRSLPGRARIHLPNWSGESPESIETHLADTAGVESVRASSATRNVLVTFDREVTDERTILDTAALAAKAPPDGGARARPRRAERLERRRGGSLNDDGPQDRRARIAVRGLDREPELARHLVERLGGVPGVRRVSPSPLTGRVLVEFSEHELELEDLLAEIEKLERPELPGEDTPRHPLDPTPLAHSSSRTLGALLGLGLLAARRAIGAQGPPVTRPGPAEVAGALGIVEGLPPVAERVEAALGPTGGQLLFGGVGLASLTFSGSALGLAVAGAGALRLVLEVRARRAAWREYEARLGGKASPHPGARVRIGPGERVPLPGTVVEGFGTAIGANGLPSQLSPGADAEAGAGLYGGPCAIELGSPGGFTPPHRAGEPRPSAYERYLRAIGPVSLGYAALTGLFTRSPARALTALLLVNPRAALSGAQSADNGAAARALRSGVTVVGSREHRPIRLPDALLLACPRVLTDGLQVSGAVALAAGSDEQDVLCTASGVSAAAGSPWGRAFAASGRLEAVDGAFDGRTASAELGGHRWTLARARGQLAEDLRRGREPGDVVLLLRRQGDAGPRGAVILRPRVAPGAADLVECCARHGVRVRLVCRSRSRSADAIARRVGVELVTGAELASVVRRGQRDGEVVAVVSDSAASGEAFAGADLAIALTSGLSGHFPARADLLAPSLGAVAAIVATGALRDTAVRDSVLCSMAANAAGAAWGLGGAPAFRRASRATYVGALAAIGVGGVRLRGGRRPRSVAERLADPLPERWGRESPEAVLEAFGASPRGLSGAEAERRWIPRDNGEEGNPFLAAVVDQLRSPLTAVLLAGAGTSFWVGAMADVGLIAAVIAANALVGAWQERQAGRAADALEQLSARAATVLRDGGERLVTADEVVPGDVLVLTAGERVVADARLIEVDGLEVDEAALTGESLPVVKMAAGGTDASRIVLEGSDVTVGSGRAVVVAVGEDTRIGSTAAALARDEAPESQLGRRLNRMMRQVLPLVAVGGALVTVSGILWGGPLIPQLALGASVAIAALPEGLPLLAGVAQTAVARRLADRRVLVRRLASVEALGRVDVACADKTGTLTEGRLAVTVVADSDGNEGSPDALPPALAEVLLDAALASPRPDAPEADAHPTDIAVLEAARRAGLADRLRAQRGGESAFDPVRSFHATIAHGRLSLKGAAEALVPRCTRIRRGREHEPLDTTSRAALLAAADALAQRGLRVLMVAEGPEDGDLADPEDLVAVGFIGISDPLRSSVPLAVERCAAAGVRLIMLTGDHPATARAIARQAGLDGSDDALLTGPEIAELDDAALDERLEPARVIARMSPLDKLRIVEALQRRGHVVGMTGDGVNDAPALRLADVGIAIGTGATEVARQAADVVVADGDFSMLVETLLEGRSFWRNIRRSLGLLLGGNLGEVGLMAGSSMLGLRSPLTTRQVLAVNLVTDVLPAVAVAIQEPAQRELASLAREGTASLGAPLRDDIIRRGVVTAVPSIAAYLAAGPRRDGVHARAVAFSSIVATQLGQTLALGRAGGQLTTPVAAGVAGSAGVLALTLTLPPLRGFLGLAPPTPVGLALILAATLSAVALHGMLTAADDAHSPPAGT